MSDVEFEPNGRLASYGTPGLFFHHTVGPDLCEVVDFRTGIGAGIQASAWERCGRAPFALVFGGEFADDTFAGRGIHVCWRHLRELGDTGLLVVRPLAGEGWAARNWPQP